MFWNIFLVSLISSCLARICVIPVLERLRIYDIPNHRTVHANPTLGMGGLIFISGYFCSLLFALFFQNPQIDDDLLTRLIAILGGTVCIIILGAVDDLINLKPKTKFSVECVLGLFLCQCGIIIDQITLMGHTWTLGAWAVPFTILWIVGIINAINMMDGLDGLSGGTCLIIFLSMALFQPTNPLVYLLFPGLIGGVIIFLFDNWHPAKIFMGDVGSLFLGYHIAVFSILIVDFNSNPMGAMAPILLLGLPIIDTFSAMFRRAQLGKPIFQADKLHIHHQLLSLGISHRRVVIILCSVSSMLAVLVHLGFSADPQEAQIITILSCLLVLYLLLHLKTIKLMYQRGHKIAYSLGFEEGLQAQLKANDPNGSTNKNNH